MKFLHKQLDCEISFAEKKNIVFCFTFIFIKKKTKNSTGGC